MKTDWRKWIMALNWYVILKLQYKMRKITTADVWAHVDSGDISEAQATSICGPRPVSGSDET